MRILLKVLVATVLLMLACCLNAAKDKTSKWYSIKDRHVNLRVDLFLSSTCPYCAKADAFFKALEANDKNLEIHRYIINQDKTALETFNRYLQAENSSDFSVPAIFFCNSHWIGIPNHGKQLLQGINYCRKQIVATGFLTSSTERMLDQISSAAWYKERLVVKASSKSFVFLMAILSSLTPAAVFSVLCLYAFIILRGTEKSTLIPILVFFALSVGLVSSLQQMSPENFYRILSWARFPAIIVGLLLLFSQIFYFAKKRLYAHLLMIFTFLLVEIYQQLYTPNFSLIFYQWLSAENLSNLSELGYILLFQVLHIILMILIALALVLSSTYFAKWYKRQMVVKVFANHYFMLLALILIFYPYLLSKLIVSMVLIFLALITSWLQYHFQKKSSVAI